MNDAIILDDGSILMPSGDKILQNGIIIKSNGDAILKDGTLIKDYESKQKDIERMNQEEISAINAVLDKLNYNSNEFRIKKSAETYTTLTYKDRDLLRLRIDDKEKSIRIFMPPELKSKYIDNKLFTNQTNKNQLFWFSYINNLFDYNDILLDVIEWINKA